MHSIRATTRALLAVAAVVFLCLIPASWVAAAPSMVEADLAMRDGVQLYTRVYLPDPAIWGPGPYPSIISTTPYGIGNRGVPPAQWPAYVLYGYAYVTQDHRGRYQSQGVWNRLTDGKDGYDTIEWMAAQSWCNDKIGMVGASAGGIAAYQTAGETPPHLTTVVAMIASADSQNNSTYYGGAIKWETLLGWVLSVSSGLSPSHLASLGLTPAEITAEKAANAAALYDLMTHRGFTAPARPVDSATWMTLPLTEVPGVGLIGTWDWILTNFAVQNEYRDAYTVWQGIQVPTLHVGGWYDIFSRGTMEAYTKIAGNGIPDQQMYMTKGIHGTVATLIPPTLILRWFDYWLKGINNGIMDEPAVHYYLMGADEWRTTEQWPPAGVADAVYYLHADGTLSTAFPAKDDASTTYLYDPLDPVLTYGGRNLMISAGPMDQRAVEPPYRTDVLVYTSDVLQEDVVVAGNVQVVLYASSDALDTDFTAKLVDVYPDGTAINVLDEMLRARFRESPRYEVSMTPGKRYELVLDLGDTAQVFKAGHRIQVDISSSNFPCKDRNTNTGNTLYTVDGVDNLVVAANTIHHDLYHRSYVVLPIINGKFTTFQAKLGDDPKPSLLDQDIFTFDGTEGETVVIRLDAAPWKSGINKRATLILEDSIHGVRLLKWDGSTLPNELTATLPKTGTYRIIVAEQPLLLPGMRYRGDYTLTMEASRETCQTLEPTAWVE